MLDYCVATYDLYWVGFVTGVFGVLVTVAVTERLTKWIDQREKA